MRTSEQLTELFAALAKAQGQITNAEKNRTNLFYKSTYADLAACWDACRKPLSDNGLCLIQMPRITPEGWLLETMLAHASGQWISDEMTMPVSKQDAQGFGIAITYLRRYALCAVLGIASEDEDGEDGTQTGNNAKQDKKKGGNPPPPPPTLPPYDQAQFDKNFPKWLEVITSGKLTAEDIIVKASTKGTLTQQQREAIMDCAPKSEQPKNERIEAYEQQEADNENA